MLLGYAHIEHPVREPLRERKQTGAARHGRRDGDDPRILLGELDERLAEHFRIHRRPDGLQHLAGFDLVRRNAVPGVRIGFRRGVAFPFGRDHVYEHRSVHFVRLLQRLDQQRQVVPVDRTEVGQTKLFEPDARDDHVFEGVLEPLGRLGQRSADGRHLLDEMLDFFLGFLVMAVGADPRQIIAQGAYIRRNGHLIVVEDDHQLALLVADMIERLERHPAGERAVPDQSDDAVVVPVQIAGDRHAHGRRERSAAVSGFPDVMLTLCTLDEAAHPVIFAERIEPAHPACQHLMNIRLMAYIVYEFVRRTVKQIVQSNR
ncbi:hypothetical protein PM3016_2924 [Paenibacillus mucilaginosus 3016]|uniref:Uncharacterized protein n=1 Tax=Paenibacillus mucilaginosus 3016 TaxID=1116391 RepID=H6NL87_9BACL|nr:hypothetical protein PM3016_2924 [Paenibacillus mucilaginosus 3016]